MSVASSSAARSVQTAMNSAASILLAKVSSTSYVPLPVTSTTVPSALALPVLPSPQYCTPQLLSANEIQALKGVVKLDTVNCTLTFVAPAKSAFSAITSASSPVQALMMFVRTRPLSTTVRPAFLIATSTVSSTSSDVPGVTSSEATGSFSPSLLRKSTLE